MARRLCVIVFDDVLLHPDYPLLVWCMGANDFSYTLEMFESILQIVSDLAYVGYRDLQICSEVDVYELWQEGGSMVRSILIRAFYKGMHGDVKTLQGFAAVWHKRFSENLEANEFFRIFENCPALSTADTMGKYCISQVTIEGIDCNCSGMLTFLLQKPEVLLKIRTETDENIEDYLKRIIWDQRSGFNPRFILSNYSDLSYLSPIHHTDFFFIQVLLPIIDAYAKRELFKKFCK